MFITPGEWLPSLPNKMPSASVPTRPHAYAHLYSRLADSRPDSSTRESAESFVHYELDRAHSLSSGLPESPDDLIAWMHDGTQSVHASYSLYLEERKGGAPRRYFSNRSHALYFLRTVAPTKLVDGAWLYGLTRHWKNPRLADLIRTYVEELGEGLADKNHVLIYRDLLSRHGLDPLDDLADDFYRQGLIQLALGWNAEKFLPEIVGFNLAYEQLPLHLLITAYELNELGLDPYYFTLHATVDNAETGHARRACQSVIDLLPRLSDGGEFWRRVREGSKLADAGISTTQVIDGFDLDREVLRIFSNKSGSGKGAHSDYCKVSGRSVNEWLSSSEHLPAFLDQLQKTGWIHRGEPVGSSRFWNLLKGEKAEMFGVFSSYELQVIHDWIRGDASADGLPHDASDAGAGKRRPTFRAAARLANARPETAPTPDDQPELLDSDLAILKRQLQSVEDDARTQLLAEVMSPAQHWTPAGLHATALYCKEVGAGIAYQ
ncbi:MAG TPA: iron-containing redox enzyme family protein [Polaromonas sp.]|uniref:iron-containing redox enzyme family protein n=1 Tax=Polaromonas sp. TaxID=1869339 RepID=UPI002D406E6D|nr:iron-containing redox enzyme family protein [Polaromonas sp.]HYW57142.1 iron-containing redox enzyme family protein [Polaromonas sp.]